MKIGCFLEVDVQYTKQLHNNGLPFLPKRIKIEKVGKLAVNLHGKKEYVIHIRNLKQALKQYLEKKSKESLNSVNNLG